MSNPIHSSPDIPFIYLISNVYTELGKEGFRQRDSGSKGLEMGTSWIPSKKQKEGQCGWRMQGERQLEMTLAIYKAPVGFVVGLVCFLSVVGMRKLISICKRSHWSWCGEWVTRRQEKSQKASEVVSSLGLVRGDGWLLPSLSSLFLLCTCMQSLQLCPTLWDPMDYSPPGSSVHGIL